MLITLGQNIQSRYEKRPGPFFGKKPCLHLYSITLEIHLFFKKKIIGLDHNKNINNNWEDKDRTLLHSKDFSKIDSKYLDDYSNSQFVTKTTEITTTKKESTIKNSYTKQPPAR